MFLCFSCLIQRRPSSFLLPLLPYLSIAASHRPPYSTLAHHYFPSHLWFSLKKNIYIILMNPHPLPLPQHAIDSPSSVMTRLAISPSVSHPSPRPSAFLLTDNLPLSGAPLFPLLSDRGVISRFPLDKRERERERG